MGISIFLKVLTQFAVSRKYKLISGSISYVDMLKHFYEKQNFNVELDYGKKSGYIKWENNKLINSNTSTKTY